MKEEDFEELKKSIKQAGQIRRGQLEPSRVFEFKPSDIKTIRAKFNKSQPEFALMIGVSVATLRNWEQGRRRPEGPAMALLRIAEKSPNEVFEALSK